MVFVSPPQYRENLESPEEALNVGWGLPTFVMSLLPGLSPSGWEEVGFCPSWWGEGPGPVPLPRPHPGASWPRPLFLAEHRGRVAGFQQHVSGWAQRQGAGAGPGMGPAGEIQRQQPWDRGKGLKSPGKEEHGGGPLGHPH